MRFALLLSTLRAADGRAESDGADKENKGAASLDESEDGSGSSGSSGSAGDGKDGKDGKDKEAAPLHWDTVTVGGRVWHPLRVVLLEERSMKPVTFMVRDDLPVSRLVTPLQSWSKERPLVRVEEIDEPAELVEGGNGDDDEAAPEIAVAALVHKPAGAYYGKLLINSPMLIFTVRKVCCWAVSRVLRVRWPASSVPHSPACTAPRRTRPLPSCARGWRRGSRRCRPTSLRA